MTFVPITRDGAPYDHAWIDDADAELVCRYAWFYGGGYAICGRRIDPNAPAGSGVPMHRFIFGLDPGDRVVHHINEDQLDNRRSNLLIVADKLAHGDVPHPRRNARCSPRLRDKLPPHEREVALAAAERAARAKAIRDSVQAPTVWQRCTAPLPPALPVELRRAA